MGDGRKSEVAHESVLVLELVSESRLRPSALYISTLVIESGAIDISNRIGGKIEELATGIDEAVDVDALMVVLEAAKGGLPARRSGQRQFGARQQIVLSGPLVRIGRKNRSAIEIPLSGDSRTTVRVLRTHTEQCLRRELHSHIAALRRIRISAIDALACGIELRSE